MIATTPLVKLLDDYALRRRIEASSEYQMRRTLRLFEQWLHRPATAADLLDDLVSRWLRDLEQTHARCTVAGHRVKLLLLWRFAADAGECSGPRRVRSVRRPEPCPIAWTIEEMQSLLAAIDQLRGRFPGGPPRREYCRALLLAAYDTGLRRGDLWNLRREQIRPDGTVVLRQHKTGQRICPRLRAATVAAVLQLDGERPLRCPFRSTGSWYQFWRRHVTLPAKVRHGAMQQIRRTGATQLATEHRDAVQRYLGHRTSEMQRHYVDDSIAQPQPFWPRDFTMATRDATRHD